MFFDFHIHGDHKLALEALKIGYHGVVLVNHSEELEKHLNLLKSTAEYIKHVKNISRLLIQKGVEIKAENPEDLKRKVKKFRNKTDVLLVQGGNLKINRAATEDPRVDILCYPYRSRVDSGINHVLAAKAAENRVAIEINLKYLLMNRPNQRHRVLSQFRQIVKLHRKFKFPVIITSDANSIYDLHSPRDVVALAGCFGMTLEEATKAMSTVPQEIMERGRLRDQIIVSGVRLVKNESMK
jgi:ribonuclease P/MRP protein subunit RPP1